MPSIINLRIKKLFVIAVLVLLQAGCGGGSNDNPPIAVGGPFTEAAQVGTDDQGNFVALWKSGASVWARDYPQGVGATPFRLAYADQPRLALNTAGDALVAYQAASSSNPRYRSVYLRRFERNTQTWQAEMEHRFWTQQNAVDPEIAVYDGTVALSAMSWNGVDWNQNQLPLNTRQLLTATAAADLSIVWNNSGITEPITNVQYPNGTNKLRTSLAMGANNQGIIAWTQQSPDGVYAAPYVHVETRIDRSNWRPTTILAHRQAGALKSAMQPAGSGVVGWVEHDPQHPDQSVVGGAIYNPASGAWTTTHYQYDVNNIYWVKDSAAMDVDMDPQGNALMLWPDRSGLAWSRYDAATSSWSNLQRLMPAGNYGGIALDLSPNGSGMAVWSLDGEIYLSHFDPNGPSWSTPEKIGFGNSPDVVTDDSGNCLAVWEESGFLYDYQCSDVTMTVSVTNNIGGRVTSQPAGIDCGKLSNTDYTYCTAPFDLNNRVTLDAQADASYMFTGWGGDCAGINGTPAIVTMDAAKNCTASFDLAPANTYRLTVILDGGPGMSGVFTGETPTPQLECYLDYASSNTCITNYVVGSNVVLYKDVASGVVLDLEGCTPGLDGMERPICTVTMDAHRTVRGQLRPTHILSLTIDGQPARGSTVFSSGSSAGDLYCVSPDTTGTTCFTEIPEGDELLLDWGGPAGYGIQSWNGCTTELDANNRLLCRIVMGADHSVTATFSPSPPPSTSNHTLTVVIEGGPGAATVYDHVANSNNCGVNFAISMSTSCTFTFAADSDVVLRGFAHGITVITGWEGCTVVTDSYSVVPGDLCRLTMDSDRTVTMHFQPGAQLFVSINGQVQAGTTVFSSGSTQSLNCLSTNQYGTNCNTIFPLGEEVLLDWSNPGGYDIQSWSGCTPELDINNRSVCRILMDANHNVTATFGP